MFDWISSQVDVRNPELLSPLSAANCPPGFPLKTFIRKDKKKTVTDAVTTGKKGIYYLIKVNCVIMKTNRPWSILRSVVILGTLFAIESTQVTNEIFIYLNLMDKPNINKK